jgi:hypothetical protein
MDINIWEIFVICVLAGLAYWANGKLNTVPLLKNVLDVLIVVVAVLLLLQSLGLGGNVNTHIKVN